MDIDVMLCNHAEAAENKLFLVGGGINMAFVPAVAPHVISVGLGLIIHVPYQLTNQGHTLTVTLRDEDGNPAVPWQAEGMPEPPPVQLTMPFNIGRPPFIQPGDEQTIALAVNFNNLPLAKTGMYSFELEVDGAEAGHQSLRVMTPPPGLGPILPAAPMPGAT